MVSCTTQQVQKFLMFDRNMTTALLFHKMQKWENISQRKAEISVDMAESTKWFHKGK